MLRKFIFFACLVSLSGCFLPMPQFVPAFHIDCRVVDKMSGAPISKARIVIDYTEVIRGPFITDAEGRVSIYLEKEVLSPSGEQAGFAGGYTRVIRVTADGYRTYTCFTAVKEDGSGLSNPSYFKLEKL